MFGRLVRVFYLLFFLRAMTLPAEEALLYRWEPSGCEDNFGDALSQPLVERILGRKVKRAMDKEVQKVLAIGSILHSARDGDTVWGSGIMTGWFPETISRLDVRAVRGPLTREILLSRGISCPEVYGDPALLFGILFPEFEPNPIREYIVIPHASEISLFESDPNLVSPREPWEVVVQKIVESKFVISSSLHGIIVAEAYGIPARMVLAANHSQYFKYQDYYYGTGRPDFKYAESVEEALKMGGEKRPICDIHRLLNSFPYDLWR